MNQHSPPTLDDVLCDNALRFPDVPAYLCGDRRLSHAGLLARARRLASALARAGVNHQDRVSVLSMNSIEFGEVMAAGHGSGFIVATVNFRLAPPEISYIVNDSAPRALIFEAQYLALIGQLRPQLTSVELYVCVGGESDWARDYEAFLASGDAEGPPFTAREDDIACLLYTSGTTGRPKGCILGQREMRCLAQTMTNEMRSGSADRILLVMPLFHIGAMAMAMGIHFRGGTAVLHRQFEPAAALRSIEGDRITILHLAPTLVQMLLDQPGAETADFSSVRTVVYSAAPMTQPLLRRALELLPNAGFLNLYGQTEVITSGLPRELHRPDGSERERGFMRSVGHPFPNTQVRIVDEQGRDCAAGVPGEIVVKTASIFRGYWNNHAATLEALRDGFCHTGDVGKFDDDGLLYLVDRKKDVIISGGENIYSREVEDAVLQHPAVSECAVIGIPDAQWGESVCAVVVLKPGSTLTENDVVEHTRARIASYKKPKRVLFVAEIPKLPTGKVNKVELRKRCD
jgi:acyl-CoA synthetase (AMP-forming)/AMP-acid ligase II